MKSRARTVLGDYLVATKIYDTLVYAARQYDIVPLISATVADRWDGSDLVIDVIVDGSYKAQPFVSDAALPSTTVETVKTTLKPVSYGLNIPVTDDLIEDNRFDLIQRARALFVHFTECGLS
jgi:hypothetical protein